MEFQNVGRFWKVILFKKWRPNFSRGYQAAFYLSLALFFTVLGALVLASNSEIVVLTLPYTGQTSINFTVPKRMSPPVFLLYELRNFHQNNRIYSQSKSNSQLMGYSISETKAKLECGEGSALNSDFISLGYNVSWGGVPLDPGAVASPCGLIAKSYFNDSYSIVGADGQELEIAVNNISWKGDRGTKFKMANNSQATQWINPQNEHFINWMRTAGLPNFQKLWGRIEQPLNPATYTLKIQNNYNITTYGGEKAFVITTVSEFGGRNVFEGWAILSIGILNLLMALFNSYLAYKQRRES